MRDYLIVMANAAFPGRMGLMAALQYVEASEEVRASFGAVVADFQAEDNEAAQAVFRVLMNWGARGLVDWASSEPWQAHDGMLELDWLEGVSFVLTPVFGTDEDLWICNRVDASAPSWWPLPAPLIGGLQAVKQYAWDLWSARIPESLAYDDGDGEELLRL